MASGDTETKLRDYLKRVTVELSLTRERLREAETARHEPVAIVGMACRLPGGVTSPRDLWRVVSEGIDTVAPFPADRGWPVGTPGLGYHPEAALLDDASGYDHAFFDISAGEALAMDPQHGLLLETCWEAFEQARMDATSPTDRRTGVFMGLNGALHCLAATLEPNEANRLHSAFTGAGPSRIAFHLGLRGPAISIDSACASSLIGIHMAIGSLRNRECELALAGGVQLLPSTLVFDEYGRLRKLAGDGRMKPFSADADGTGPAEGAGVILLERLSDAERNGHRVLAVLRGSAVNQDGVRAEFDSLSELAQQQMIEAALADAHLRPGDVDVVEAHGDGTLGGDQLEAEALSAIYGREHTKDSPLWVGSAKSNWGNTSAAAGVLGVIKMVMAMRHGVLPKTLHAETPSPYLGWSKGGTRLLSQSRPWPETGAPRRAGVSAHAVLGSNAHVILEQAPATQDGPPRQPEPVSVPWVLSGKSAAALRAQAERLAARFAESPELPLDVAYSLATTRASFGERAAVVGSDATRLLAGLRAIASGQDAEQVVRGGGTGGSALVFSGQGVPSPDSVDRLCAAHPHFATVFEEIRGRLGSATGPGLRFAVDVALYRLLEHWGITVDYLNGHSIGEISLGHVCGVLSLADACALVAAEAYRPPRTEAALERMRRIVAGLSFRTPAKTVLSNLTGTTATDADLRDPEHWFGLPHRTAQLTDSLKALSANGVTAFFELGAAGVLARAATDPVGHIIPVLDSRFPEPTSITMAVARAHVWGLPVDWHAYYADTGARAVDLPTYPFQRRDPRVEGIDGGQEAPLRDNCHTGTGGLSPT